MQLSASTTDRLIGLRQRYGSGFPNPWLDASSLFKPRDFRTLLDWAEKVMEASPTYRSSQQRVIAYFLTEVEIRAQSGDKLGDDEQEKWKTFLQEQIGAMQVLKQIGEDWSCYGNGFMSLTVPFRRLLSCPRCAKDRRGGVYQLEDVMKYRDFQFRWKMPNFVATCPRCRYSGVWNVTDVPENLERRLKVKHWSPKEIAIEHDIYTDDTSYEWMIPPEYRRDIQQGRAYALARAPQSVITAVANAKNFRFFPGMMFHMKEMTYSGRQMFGWGMPRSMLNFPQIFYVQVLRRSWEALGLDYIVPLRILTPETAQAAMFSGPAPMISQHMGDWKGELQRMIQRHRIDPTGYATLPFPVRSTLVGGEAGQFMKREIMDEGVDTLLNAAQFPVEMYRGSMALETTPVSLRLFESVWSHLPQTNNRALQWLTGLVSLILQWETVVPTLSRVKYTDDFNRQLALLQLVLSQQVSETTALRALDLDFKTEERRKMEEAKIRAELQAELQEKMDQAALGEAMARGQMAGPAGGGMGPPGMMGAPGSNGAPQGAAPMGGAPAGAGGPMPGPVTQYLASGAGVPKSLDDMVSLSDSLAKQLLSPTTPESVKDSELRQLKRVDPNLHSLTRSRMDEIRQQMQLQGGAMLMSQQPA